jgi:hypothetical protein
MGTFSIINKMQYDHFGVFFVFRGLKKSGYIFLTFKALRYQVSYSKYLRSPGKDTDLCKKGKGGFLPISTIATPIGTTATPKSTIAKPIGTIATPIY